MTPPPIRVLIVDDHAMVRRGLRAYLMGRADLTVVGEAGDGQEALESIPALAPDVVLMDIQMPRLDGVEATRRLRRQYPALRVLILTSHQEQERVYAALQSGASGYLLKDASEEELAAAIRLVHAGHTLLPPGTTAPTPGPASPAAQAAFDLSHREREILSLMVAGLTNKEIARRTSLSLSTVKFHASNVMAKLGVASRTEATAVALQHGLVSRP